MRFVHGPESLLKYSNDRKEGKRLRFASNFLETIKIQQKEKERTRKKAKVQQDYRTCSYNRKFIFIGASCKNVYRGKTASLVRSEKGGIFHFILAILMRN